MDVTRMTRLAHWNLYTLAENYPEYMDNYMHVLHMHLSLLVGNLGKLCP